VTHSPWTYKLQSLKLKGMTSNKEILIKFGNSIKGLRKDKNLSQEQFAMLCQLDRTYISGLERGLRNPTLMVLASIADQLGVDLSELFKDL
jgi:transcriptional regulator with XRE-family HTH domain